jgi:translocation and assembly module TamA
MSYLAPGLAAALFLAAVAGPAGAFELFGRKFFEGDGDAEVAVVPDAQPYTLALDVAGADPDLTEAIQSASALAREEARPPPGTAGLLARARGDYGRIVAALYARGYYGGTVSITVGGAPVEGVRPDVVLPDPVAVGVAVDPGPLFRFGSIRIDGLPESALTREDAEALDLDDWTLTGGDEARSGAVLATEGRLVELWRQRGHPKARVATRDIVADHRTQTVDVTLAVEPGPAAQLGQVEIAGTERMDPAFVRWATGIRPGEAYDPDTLERARARLQRLGVFSSVAIAEDAAVGPDGILPITFNTSERKRRLIGGGASLSTVEGAALEGYWMHRNLFGRAESLRFDASVSRIGAEGYGDLNYALAGTFRKPAMFTPDTDLTLQVAAEREFVDTYESRSVNAAVGLEHRFSEDLTGRTALNVERSHIEDAFGENDFLLVSLPTDLDYDGRDDKLDPTEGLRGTLHAEPFVDLLGSTTALVGRGSVSGYFSPGDNDRVVLAGRAALGSIVGGELEDIPATRRFFLGGGGSIRGYDYRTIGPRIDGDIVGGLSFWEASAELRFKMTDRIGIVPFIDAGSAYPDPIPDFSEDVFVGAGLGLRYYTPLGPLRFDIATPLTPRDGDPSFAIYVGLGQAF